MGGAVSSIGNAIGDVVGGVGDVVGDVVGGVGDVLDGAVELVSDAGSAIDDFVNEEIPGGWITVAAVAGGGYMLSQAGAAGAAGGAAGGSAAAADAAFALADATQLAAQGLSQSQIASTLAATGIEAGTANALAAAGFDAAFVAKDAAQLAAQGLNPTQIASTLEAAGVDSFVAADAAQLAAQGLGEADIASNVLQSGAGTTSGSFLQNIGDVYRGVSNLLGGGGGGQQATTGGTSGLFGQYDPLTAGLGGALLQGLGTQDYINKLQDLGAQAQTQYGNLAQQATENIQFTPYGVTTSLFGTTPTEGGITSTLTGQGQQLSDAALQAALGSYQQAGTADLGQMTQERMNLYQQLVGPEQQRARLASEARLASQGRLGLGAGGGEYAPELRALEDAIAKQNLQFALQAPQEALAQRTALLQQGASAAAIPTGLAGQQLQAAQLGGTLGQQAAQTAYQQGSLFGDLAGRGIGTNLTANIAAALVQGERNKALATALQGGLFGTPAPTGSTATPGINPSGGTSGIGGLLNTAQQAQQLYNTGTGLFNSVSSIFV